MSSPSKDTDVVMDEENDMHDGPSFAYQDETHTTVYTDPCTDGACLRSVTGSTPLTAPCTDDGCLPGVATSTPFTNACVDGACLHSATNTPPAPNATMPTPCGDATICGKPGACSLPLAKKKGVKKSNKSALSDKGLHDKTPKSKTNNAFVITYDDEANEIDVQKVGPEDAKELDDLARDMQYWMPNTHVRVPRRSTDYHPTTDLSSTVRIPVVDFATNITVNVEVPVTEDFRLKMISKKMARNALLFAAYPHLDFEAGTPHPLAYSGYEEGIAKSASVRAKKDTSSMPQSVTRKMQPPTKLQYQPSFFQVPVLEKSTREFADQIMPPPIAYTPLSTAAKSYETTRDATHPTTSRNFAAEHARSLHAKRYHFNEYDDALLSRHYLHPAPNPYQNLSDSQLSLLRRDAELLLSPHVHPPVPHAMTDDVIDTFINVTGQSVPIAIQSLQMCHGDLRQALHHFYDNTKM